MSGFFTGHFARPKYDTCAYPEDLYQSTSPYEYTMNTDRIHNCNGALTVFGPRSSLYGAGVSTPRGDQIAAAQQYVDIDSVLSNRNVPLGKCKRSKLNPIDVTKIKTQNLPVSDDYLDAQHTKMTDPAMYYRGVSVNRFYEVLKDPQANIFYDWAIDSNLEMRDNYIFDAFIPLENDTTVPDSFFNPAPRDDSWDPKSIPITYNGNCGNRGVDPRTQNRRNNELNKRRAVGRGLPSQRKS